MSINNESGASAVEFAIVLPLFLIIVFGIIEFGIVLYNKSMLTNASREGARYGILYEEPVHDNDSIKAKVYAKLDYTDANPENSLLINLGNPGATLSVEVDPSNPAARTTGTDITVKVNYLYDFLLLPNFLPGLPDPINLSTATTMRME